MCSKCPPSARKHALSYNVLTLHIDRQLSTAALQRVLLNAMQQAFSRQTIALADMAQIGVNYTLCTFQAEKNNTKKIYLIVHSPKTKLLSSV